MKVWIVDIFVASLVLLVCPLTSSSQVDFTSRVVAENLFVPWDMLEGPDGKIWFTTRNGFVCRVHPDTRELDTLLDLSNVVASVSEIGLLGMALHPQFADSPYVFCSYIERISSVLYKKITRYRLVDGKLRDGNTIYTLWPVATWHQGCRMMFLPDGTLMFTNGDLPQSDSTFNPQSDAGKICRIHSDGRIPADNPFPNSRAWSVGHRNPQGLCMLPDGTIFIAEHGNIIEDEINLITKGGNYGWPLVEGPCDLPLEIEVCRENQVIEPAWSTGNRTLAPSALEYYNHTLYPALAGKLICTFLKASRLLTFGLTEDHQRVAFNTELLNYRHGRIRDVLILKSGRVFICTGNSGFENIEPFPRPNHDVILELLPVWVRKSPVVHAARDTTIVRADPGTEVLNFVEFCSVGDDPVFYTGFDNYPNNIMEARFWQDGASTEKSSCYPFRVIYKPDSSYPHFAVSIVWVRDVDSSEKPIVANLKGLPQSGLAITVFDTITASVSNQALVVLQNIGEDAVVITGGTFSPEASAEFSENLFPLSIAGGNISMLTIANIERMPTDRVISIGFATSSFKHPRQFIRIPGVVSVASTDEIPFGISPNPAFESLTVSGSSDAPYHLRVVDVFGSPVFTSDLVQSPATTFYFGTFNGGNGVAPGIYIAEISTSLRVYTIPFVVRR